MRALGRAAALAAVASVVITFAIPPAPVTRAAVEPAQVAPAAVDPVNCTGYPEARVPLEVQSWWTEPGISEPMHLHAMTCFPLGQNMSGTSTFDVRVMLHRSVGDLIAVNFDFYSCNDSQFPDCIQRNNLSVPPCGIANDCTYWTTFTVNWSEVPAGWLELRLKARAQFPPSFDQSPGATQITSSGYPVQVRSGTGGYRASNKYYVEGRGWYELRGYQNAQVNDWRQLVGPWSGTKTISVKMNCSCSGDDTPTTRWFAYVDPDFHNGSEGTVVGSGTGSFNGNLAIDTTQFANGPHRLVLRAGSNQPTHSVPGDLNGLQVFPFTVQN